MERIIENAGKMHFIGIGGIGVSAIAKYMLDMGVEVTGSDISDSSTIEELRSSGAKIHIGHSASNIDGDVELVVVSSAIPYNNVELVTARKRKIPIVPRYRMLAYLANSKKCIAISGSHGKTTTTSLCTLMLKEAGFEPTAIIGGKPLGIDSNLMVGEGDVFVVEADESDGGFLLLQPYVGVVTNVDNDHLSFYGSFNNEIMAFREFMENSSVKVLNLDDKTASSVRLKGDSKVMYSIKSKKSDVFAFDIRFSDGKSVFSVRTPNRIMLDLELGIIGYHNVSNALAVVSIAERLSIEERYIRKSFAEFKGVRRRFTRIGNINGVDVYDDYAHHPTEIRATISAARLICSDVFVIFQPHRYSRVSHLMDDFSRSFSGARRVFVLDIYGAFEENKTGVDSQELVRKINRVSKNATYVPSDELFRVIDSIESGGLLLGLGAGDISSRMKELVERYGSAQG